MIDRATERALVLTPRGRDSELACSMLAQHGIETTMCGDGSILLGELREGAGCAILTSEVLTRDLRTALANLLAEQPPWSDFPFIILSDGRSRDITFELGNITILERPVAPHTLLAAVRAALRGRRRQYDARTAIQQRDQFLAMLGHELRNPLSAIVLASDPIQEDVAELRAKRISIVSRQAHHLTRLVNDLLDVARVSTGKVQLRREPVDIDSVIRDCVEVLEPRARENSIAFVVSPGCGVIVEGDTQRIEQVIGNLLTNAIKYSPTGRTISIASAVVGGTCEIRVRDQGVGISSEMLPRVFDLFAQADGSLDRAEGGMGIGLALVERLVRLHGGTVAVYSEGVGKGSEFVVRLPIGNAPVKLTSVPVSSTTSGRRLRVVMVDDNADILELTSMVLSELDCDVETASDGEAGLALLLATKPDLALVDIGLPKLDGFAVARRARPHVPATTLVAISGYGQRQDRERSLAAGFDRHLTKPVTVQSLKSLIAEVHAHLDRVERAAAT